MGRSWRSPLVGACLVVLFGACSGNGCSCVDKIKGGFPVAERHESAIQLRASKSLFEYFSANGPSLIPKLLGMSAINVPPQCGDTKVCCATPAPMCRIGFDFKTLALTPAAPNLLNLSTDLVLKTVDNLPIDVIGLHCVISIDTTRAGSPTMNVASQLSFPVDATSDTTAIKAANSKVTGIDDGDLKIDEPGSTPFLCTGLGLFNGIIVSVLESQVASVLESTISSQTCMTCMDKTDCNSFASDCKDMKCVGSDGTTCVQEVGLDGRMNVGKLLSSFSPGLNAFLDIYAVLGGYAKADTGLSLGMLGGGLADPHAACVPKLPPPTPVTVPLSKTFTADTMPDGTTPFHLGIGVHRSYLDTLGFGAFDGGALCLSVGTSSVALLSAKTIGVIIPSLGDLTHGGDAPMFLIVRPGAPPTFKLGKGTFKLDDKMMKTIDDPLLKISVPRFSLDFYAFVDEHYVRILTLTADLEVPVGLDIDANHKIVPLLGDFTTAFKNVTISNSELLAEAPADLAKTFPTLLGVAGSQIGGALGPISLPALMGINIDPIAITSTDPDADSQNQFLSIFANLAVTTTASLAVDTDARLVGLTLPPTSEFAVAGRGALMPTARIAVTGSNLGDAPLEASFNVDDSGWSPFQTASELTITHPLLWMQGRHHVDVRARAVGQPETLDATPARVELLVDTIAPEGKLTRDPRAPGVVLFEATDRVSPKDALRYRTRVDGGAWSAFGVADRLVTDGDVEVEARDEAGNIGALVGFHGRTTAPSSSGCGCDVGGAGGTSPVGGALAITIFVALLVYRRRRAAALWLVVIVGGLGGVACNEASLGTGDYVAAVDEVGRYHDLAMRDGVFHLSAYDDSVGDLVYAHVDVKDLDKPISWEYVDGIADGASVDTPGGPRRGITDPGPDVGLYSSIALTSSGHPRFAYQDVTDVALKYAAGPFPFSSHVVDTGTGGVLVGRYSTISLDGSDVPTIAYAATGIPDGNAGFKSELRVAVAQGSSPSSSADWKISVVDTTRVSCAGRCATGKACIQTAMVNMMPNGDPSISTCIPVDAAPCATACSDTQACIQGVCTAFLPDVKTPDLTDGTGLFTQARRVNGTLQLVYYDHAQGDLKLAVQKPDGGFTVTLIDGGDPTTDVGQFCSAQATAGGVLHVAYVDAISDRLLYKTVSGGTPTKDPEVVDDGMRVDGPHPIGAGAALILDGDSPRVVYQDQQVADLMQARRADTWSHSEVTAATGVAGYGWWPHLASDGGKTYLSQFVYDRQNSSPPLGTLRLSTLP